MFEKLFGNLDFKKELTGLAKLIFVKKELKKLNADLEKLKNERKILSEKLNKNSYFMYEKTVRTLNQDISILKSRLEEKIKNLDSCIETERKEKEERDQLTGKKQLIENQILEKENKKQEINEILVEIEKENEITLDEIV